MLVIGKNIQSANDPLRRIEAKELYEMVKEKGTALASQIEQLRTVLSIDIKKYNILKRNLPYVVCGMFSPAYRRLDNFASIDCFMVDIDHLSEKDIDRDSLRNKLIKDTRVELLFTSPGNDGLKVLFKLKEKCFDRQKYSMFYKLFIHHFSTEYNLQQVIDKVTSDATRACFLSHDENAFFNPDAVAVAMEEYINFDNFSELQEAKTMIRSIDKEPMPPPEKRELTPDLLQEIRQKLNPKIRTEKAKDYYVPEEVEQVMEDLKVLMVEYNIELFESAPIQYGRKLKFSFQGKWSQLNLFYGKKGYKIVKTPASNSDKELSEVVYQILCQYFFGSEES